MSPVITLDLIRTALLNFALITALILVYHFFPSNLLPKSKYTLPIWIGITFGSIAAVSSPRLWEYMGAPNIGLNITLVPLAALRGGPIASIIVVIILLIATRIISGALSLVDCIAVLALFLLGSFFYFGKSWRWFPRSDLVQLILLGVCIVPIEIGFFFLIPALQVPVLHQSLLSEFILALPFGIFSCLITIILGSLITFIDRKKAVETSLVLTNKQLNLSLDAAKADTWEINLTSGELHYSERFLAFYGSTSITRSRTIKEIMAFIHPDDLESTSRNMQQYLDGTTDHYEGVTRIRDPKGNWVWYLSRGKAVAWDRSGRPTRIIGVVIDISQSKQAEEELRAAYQQIITAEAELHQRYHELALSNQHIQENEASIMSIFHVAPVGILFVFGRTIKRVNDRLCEIIGYLPDEIVGKNTRLLYLDDIEYTRIGGLDTANLRTETQWKRKDGSVRDILLTGTSIDPLKTESGKVYTVLDITDSKRTQKALDHAKEKLNMLNYIIFTDIQNQIFTALGYQQLFRAALQNIRPEAEEMIRKEKDILETISVSLKIAQTFQDLGLRPARWQNVNQVFLLAISHLDLRKIQHTVTTGSLEIFADPMLEKVFQILVDNTLSHSKTATRITLEYEKRMDGSLILIYTDDGVGIPFDRKDRVFLPENKKGISMGLFLVKEILETTDLTIRETGTPNIGVRFEITVPREVYRFKEKNES